MFVYILIIVFTFSIILIISRKRKYYIQEPFKNIWNITNKNTIMYIINNIYRISESNNITLIPIYQSLIGIIKFGDLLPWYSSFDLCIFEGDLYKLKNIMNSHLDIIYEKNYKIYKKDIIWPYISIYTFGIDNNQIILKNGNVSYTIKNEYIYPVQDYLFNNIRILIPINIEKILNIIYTKDWRKYCNSSDYNHKIGKKYFNILKIEWDTLKCIPNTISFEHTYVINLERYKIRWEKTKRNLKKIGIVPKKWVATCKKTNEVKNIYNLGFKFGMNLGTIACYLSHKKLWEYLYDINVPYALIFEDDIIIGENITTTDISNIIINSIGFNIIFLGYTNPNRNLEFDHCSKEGGGSCLHAYVVSRNGLKNLLNINYDFSQPIDKITYNFSNDFLCYLAKNTNNNGNFGSGVIFQDITIVSGLRFRFKIFGKILSL